jgi:PGF-CTERM protein
VLAAENETITGTSTMAPGSSFTVRVESQSNQDPFIERGQATVEPDGTWSTEIDLTDADPGTPLEIQVRSGTEGQVADIQGTIGSVGTISFGDVTANPATVRPGGAVEIMSTVSNPGDTSVEKSIEVMVDGEMVDEKTISLDSGESMDVTYVISTRDLSTGDHTATLAVGDSSGEVSFTIEEEETRTPRPTATDTIAPPPTATPTEAPTPTPEEVTVVVTETVEVTQEPTEEPTTTDGGDGPGFGIAVALVALLAAAFLAVRRQD